MSLLLRHSSRLAVLQQHQQRYLSSTAAAAVASKGSRSNSAGGFSPSLIPTRHSRKQPPALCLNLEELHESTFAILEEPIGKLFATASASSLASSKSLFSGKSASRTHLQNQRNHVYDIADAAIQKVEYLIRGHSSNVVGSMYNPLNRNGTSESPEDHLASMIRLLNRMQQEGEMFMKLRQEHLSVFEISKHMDDLSDSDSSDSDSDSDDSSSSSSDDEDDGKGKVSSVRSLDFAPPGATTNMYDSILDAMAVSPSSSSSSVSTDPMDFFRISFQALAANDTDASFLLDGSRIVDSRSTLATHVTYHAALRGIANKTDFGKEQHRDEALHAAFQLYNHLTHSRHLPRSSASILRMLHIVDKALPASRVKGNISFTFWKQACDMGLATDEIKNFLLSMHDGHACGPEFEVVVTKEWNTPLQELPQRYRRFAKKYRHSQDY